MDTSTIGKIATLVVLIALFALTVWITPRIWRSRGRSAASGERAAAGNGRPPSKPEERTEPLRTR